MTYSKVPEELKQLNRWVAYRLYWDEKRGKYVPSHLHLNVTYLLEADEEEVLRIKPDENSGVKWFTPDETLKACSEPWMIERVYRKLINKLQ